jgi:hexosaminidase
MIISQATWNDPGPNASTYLEAFYAMKEGIPVVAANAWKSSTRAGHLTHAQFLSSFTALEAAAPSQNLDRRIPHRGHVVVDYELTTKTNSTVRDLSGNHFDAQRTANGMVETPLKSFGHNYTFRLLSSSRTAKRGEVLLSGPDDSFGLTQTSIGIAPEFVSSNISYPLHNFTLGEDSWREIVVTGTENGTNVFVDGKPAGAFVTFIDGSKTLSVPMAFVVPLQQIGSDVARFTLWDEILDIAVVSTLVSL